MSEYDANTQDENFDSQGGESGDSSEAIDETFVTDASGKASSPFMLLFLFMIIGGGAIMFMRMRTGPSAAQAAPPTAAAAAAQKNVDEFLNDGGKSIQRMKDLLKNTEKVVANFLNYSSLNQVKLEDLKTNPFQIQAQKAPDTEAGVRQQWESEKRKATEVAGSLRIQSIIHSSAARAAMINNKMYTEGQEVDGFLIEKITPNTVQIKKDSSLEKKPPFRFVLKFNK